MPKRILIADDNEDARRAVRNLFEGRRDVEICGEAMDGQDAIEKAEQLDPDLIILDLSMPIMNGFEAARVLRRTKPAIPLILFTLHSSPIVESEASAVGIRSVVSKLHITDLVVQALAIFREGDVI